jgi:Papain fold toxin 1, glutamine deamidase
MAARPEAGLVMSGRDRPPDDQPDAPPVPPEVPAQRTPSADAAGADRGAFLTDVRPRRDYALAYRATVDAVYASYAGTQPEVAKENTDQPGERPSVVDKYPADYIPAAHEPPRVDGPYEQPEQWVRGINVDETLEGRDNNCGECARAACATWYGKPTAAAAISSPASLGESQARMEEWARQTSMPATMAEVGRRLDELGPGSSAIIGCQWTGRGGHWFNAFNDAGAVKAVDAQSALVGSWPPSEDEVDFDESRMMFSDAIFFDPDGKVLRNDHT